MRRRFLPLLALAVLLLGGCAITGKRMCVGEPLFTDQPTLFRTSEGEVALTAWQPRGRVRGIVVAVPGLDEAAREWHELGVFLARRGYATYACDVRGQGLDKLLRPRGNFDDWRRWVRDVQELSAEARRRHPRAPMYYCGLSAGALIALQAAAAPLDGVEVQGLILQSPAAALIHPLPVFRPGLAAARLLTWNRLRATTPALMRLGRSPLMSNPGDETAWELSPDRVCEGFTPKAFQGFLSLGRGTRPLLGEIRLPVLLQLGERDPVMLKKDGDIRRGAQTFLDELGGCQKTVRWYPNGLHDLLNDTRTRDAVLADVAAWLERKK